MEHFLSRCEYFQYQASCVNADFEHSTNFKFLLPQGTKYKITPQVDPEDIEKSISEFSRILAERGLFNLTQGSLFIKAVFNETHVPTPSPSRSGSSSKRKSPDDEELDDRQDGEDGDADKEVCGSLEVHIGDGRGKDDGVFGFVCFFLLPAC